jgi:hypothetical protein
VTTNHDILLVGREKHMTYYERRLKLMNGTVIKVIGVVSAVVGAVATLAGNWAGEKQQDAKIAEKVAEAMAKAGKES